MFWLVFLAGEMNIVFDSFQPQNAYFVFVQEDLAISCSHSATA